jgi:hypothetical protein
MTAVLDGPYSIGALDDPLVAQQLAAAEGRLVARYRNRAGITEERVRHTVGTVSWRFAGARVRGFLPILVERAVRHELDH